MSSTFVRALALAVLSLAAVRCSTPVVGPGTVDGSSADATSSDVDHGDAAFCDDDAGLDYAYCPDGYHCELAQGQQYAWNVCCPLGEDGGGHDCRSPTH